MDNHLNSEMVNVCCSMGKHKQKPEVIDNPFQFGNGTLTIVKLKINSFFIMEQYRKHHYVEPSAARKVFIQLDKTTYIALNKKNGNITLHICQPNTVIKLEKDQILTLLSLKSLIKETICYMSHSLGEQETSV